MKRPAKRKLKKKLKPAKTLSGISAFQDEQGKVAVWPSARRRDTQTLVLEHLAAFFESGRSYSDAEVTALLKAQSTLDDLPMLRQELIDGDYLTHDQAAQTYWRSNGRPNALLPESARG